VFIAVNLMTHMNLLLTMFTLAVVGAKISLVTASAPAASVIKLKEVPIGKTG